MREVNERIDAIDKRSPGWDESSLFEFHCECGDGGGCETTIELTLAEYERVRGEDDRFALRPGHETDGLESVVERTERFVIVDKVAEAEPLVADDPRGAPSD